MDDKKTRELTLPSSHELVARMRDIHDLDTPSPTTAAIRANENRNNVETEKRVNAHTRQHGDMRVYVESRAETPARIPIAAPDRRNAGREERGFAPSKVRRKRERTNMDDNEEPVHRAMREALVRPYEEGFWDGPHVGSTIQLPAELWKRLELAKALLKRHKQEIIGEALMRYLASVGQGET